MCIVVLTLAQAVAAAAVEASLGPGRKAVEVFRIQPGRHAEAAVVEAIKRIKAACLDIPYRPPQGTFATSHVDSVNNVMRFFIAAFSDPCGIDVTW